MELDIEDLRKPIKGSLSAPVASLRTGKAGRDKDLRRALDGERHPEIRYRIDKVESSFSSLTENTDVLLTLHGVLSMRGTERPVSFMGRVRLRQGTLWVRGENRIRPADFGVPPLPVLAVQHEGVRAGQVRPHPQQGELSRYRTAPFKGRPGRRPPEASHG